jgi:hypothetical protein
MPFDRNQAGGTILEKRVVEGTLAKRRQMQFVGKLLTSMQPTMERPELVRFRIDAAEFKEGMIRITKGLLTTLHSGFDYHHSAFDVIDLHPQPFDEQLRLMKRLRQSAYFERGERVFQCWRHVDEAQGGGVWMLVFYECFGFFVFHTNYPERHRLWQRPVP